MSELCDKLEIVHKNLDSIKVDTDFADSLDKLTLAITNLTDYSLIEFLLACGALAFTLGAGLALGRFSIECLRWFFTQKLASLKKQT